MGFRIPGAAALVTGLSAIVLVGIVGAGLPQRASAQTQTLDTITVVATKTEEKAIDALAPVSVLDLNAIQMINPKRVNELLYNVPGVSAMDRGDSPETSINIRGMQDFGRVAVVIDGARQNYQRTGHNANGSFFLEPELLAGMDVVRGPTANIYGSGAIGGVVSFRTKDVDDILRPGERFGTEIGGSAGSNASRGLISGFTAVRASPTVEAMMGGTHRTQNNYKDGSGTEVQNSSSHVSSGIAKVTLRPWDGHEFKIGGIFQEDLYNIGQYHRGPVSTQALSALNGGTSVYATEVHNYQGNVRWRYGKPEDKLFNWDANFYVNRTENDQLKIWHNSSTANPTLCGAGNFGNAISGCVGDTRGYVINTLGFDAHNTTRIDLGEWRNTFTYGGDAFQDDVATSDTRGNSNVTTPGGVRSVSGAFVQWKANYSTWLEVVSAARYDRYSLESATTSSDGSRISPKITVGITPFKGFTPYVSYAEGYRAPSITETLVAGAHVAATSSSGIFLCPSGTAAFGNPNANLFCFLPNPNLRPEVGKTKEAGLNLKYDSVLTAGDSIRGKFNAYRNDLEDYIELTSFGTPFVFGGSSYYPFYQYQNIPKAHIQGFEAETMYDAGAWFVGISGHIMRGYNDVTNEGLINIQGDKLVTTAGLRFLERKMTVAASWISVAANRHVPANYMPSSSYELLNLYFTYQPHKDVSVNLTVDNALDKYYRPYAIPRSSDGGGTQNDVLWASVPPGVVYKAALRMHFGAM